MRPRPAHPHPRGRLLRGAALVAVPAVAIVSVGVGGAAWAYWSSDGGGAGSGRTDAVSAVSLSPGAPAAQLYPGASAGVVLAITNPNAATVHVGSLALDGDQGEGGFSVDAGHPACDVSALAFTTGTNGVAGWSVPGVVGGTAGTVTVTLPGALSMSLDADQGCQGAVVTVYLSAGP